MPSSIIYRKKMGLVFSTARVVDWLVYKLTVEHWSGPAMKDAFAQS
jgi:hypothetical protein